MIEWKAPASPHATALARPGRVCRRRQTALDFGFPVHRDRGSDWVGKSRLAERLGPASMRRRSSTTPTTRFSPTSTPGRAGAAFQAQLFFTLGRHRQQTALRQSDLFSQLTVCDYLFERDKIYAYLNLDDNELFIYQRLYELLAPDLPAPDLVDLPADADRRAAPPPPRSPRAEPDTPRLDEEYVAGAERGVQAFFFHYTATPLLVVETSQFDLDLGRRRPRRSDAADRRWAWARGTTRQDDERRPAQRLSQLAATADVARLTGAPSRT